MEEEYFNSYKSLSINDKRDVLIRELSDMLNVIENICTKRKIKIDKLKSAYFLKNRKLLFENDYYDLMFIYLNYIKEDLASLI